MEHFKKGTSSVPPISILAMHSPSANKANASFVAQTLTRFNHDKKVRNNNNEIIFKSECDFDVMCFVHLL